MVVSVGTAGATGHGADSTGRHRRVHFDNYHRGFVMSALLPYTVSDVAIVKFVDWPELMNVQPVNETPPTCPYR